MDYFIKETHEIPKRHHEFFKPTCLQDQNRNRKQQQQQPLRSLANLTGRAALILCISINAARHFPVR